MFIFILSSNPYPKRKEQNLKRRLTEWFVRPIVRRWDNYRSLVVWARCVDNYNYWYNRDRDHYRNYRPPTIRQFYSQRKFKMHSMDSESLLSAKLENLTEFEEETNRIEGESNRGQSTLVGNFVFWKQFLLKYIFWNQFFHFYWHFFLSTICLIQLGEIFEIVSLPFHFIFVYSEN